MDLNGRSAVNYGTISAIANNGTLMRPMLVDRLEDSDHNIVAKYSPQRVRQVIGEPAAKLMVQALKTVVGPEGTAPKAALEHYPVAGKTGTAQKAEEIHLHGRRSELMRSHLNITSTPIVTNRAMCVLVGDVLPECRPI